MDRVRQSLAALAQECQGEARDVEAKGFGATEHSGCPRVGLPDTVERQWAQYGE